MSTKRPWRLIAAQTQQPTQTTRRRTLSRQRNGCNWGGRALFTDRNLSDPAGTACATCHQPDQGFAGNNGSGAGVSQGSRPGVLGHRNAMTNSYQGLVPAFGFITEEGKTEARGSHFWDGRVDTAALQALGPLLNPLEMNNPSRQAVVDKVATFAYAEQFRRVFGANVLANTGQAFSQIGVAIAAFEPGALQPFNATYDAMLRGQTTLNAAETRGLALFQGPQTCQLCGLPRHEPGQPSQHRPRFFLIWACAAPTAPCPRCQATPQRT